LQDFEPFVHSNVDVNYFHKKSYDEITSLVVRPIQRATELDQGLQGDHNINNMSMQVDRSLRTAVSQVAPGLGGNQYYDPLTGRRHMDQFEDS